MSEQLCFWSLVVKPGGKDTPCQVEEDPSVAQFIHVTGVALARSTKSGKHAAEAAAGPHCLTVEADVEGGETTLAWLQAGSHPQHSLDFVLDASCIFRWGWGAAWPQLEPRGKSWAQGGIMHAWEGPGAQKRRQLEHWRPASQSHSPPLSAWPTRACVACVHACSTSACACPKGPPNRARRRHLHGEYHSRPRQLGSPPALPSYSTAHPALHI